MVAVGGFTLSRDHRMWVFDIRRSPVTLWSFHSLRHRTSPWWNSWFTIFTYEKMWLSMEIIDLPLKNGDFPMKNGDFPMNNGDLPMKNGDFPWFFVCFEAIPWFHLPTGPTCGGAVEPSREQRVRDTSEPEIYVKWIYEWIYTLW